MWERRALGFSRPRVAHCSVWNFSVFEAGKYVGYRGLTPIFLELSAQSLNGLVVCALVLDFDAELIVVDFYGRGILSLFKLMVYYLV